MLSGVWLWVESSSSNSTLSCSVNLDWWAAKIAKWRHWQYGGPWEIANPDQCIIIRKSLKISIDLYYLIPPKWVYNTILPPTLSRYWPSYDQWITGSLEPFWQEVPSEKKLEENQQHQWPWQYQPQTVHDYKRNPFKNYQQHVNQVWYLPQRWVIQSPKITIHVHWFHPPQKWVWIQRNHWLDCQQLQGLQRQRQPTSKMLSSCFKRSFSLSTLRLNACSSANKRRKDASPEKVVGLSWRAAI